MGLVAQFVPAAASATAGQTALNVAMDANPILLVISLIGMLVGALLNFSGKNKEVANGFQSVWAGVEDFMSYIFEGLMRIVGGGHRGLRCPHQRPDLDVQQGGVALRRYARLCQ